MGRPYGERAAGSAIAGAALPARETFDRHTAAFGNVPVLANALDVGGEYAYRVRGEVIDIHPAESDADAIRVELFDDEIESLSSFDPLTGEVKQKLPRATVFPKTHYVTQDVGQQVAFGTSGHRGSSLRNAFNEAHMTPDRVVVSIAGAFDRGAFLDARVLGDEFPHAFPAVFAACLRSGLDPRTSPIPVEWYAVETSPQGTSQPTAGPLGNGTSRLSGPRSGYG